MQKKNNKNNNFSFLDRQNIDPKPNNNFNFFDRVDPVDQKAMFKPQKRRWLDSFNYKDIKPLNILVGVILIFFLCWLFFLLFNFFFDDTIGYIKRLLSDFQGNTGKNSFNPKDKPDKPFNLGDHLKQHYNLTWDGDWSKLKKVESSKTASNSDSDIGNGLDLNYFKMPENLSSQVSNSVVSQIVVQVPQEQVVPQVTIETAFQLPYNRYFYDEISRLANLSAQQQDIFRNPQIRVTFCLNPNLDTPENREIITTRFNTDFSGEIDNRAILYQEISNAHGQALRQRMENCIATQHARNQQYFPGLSASEIYAIYNGTLLEISMVLPNNNLSRVTRDLYIIIDNVHTINDIAQRSLTHRTVVAHGMTHYTRTLENLQGISVDQWNNIATALNQAQFRNHALHSFLCSFNGFLDIDLNGNNLHNGSHYALTYLHEDLLQQLYLNTENLDPSSTIQERIIAYNLNVRRQINELNTMMLDEARDIVVTPVNMHSEIIHRRLNNLRALLYYIDHNLEANVRNQLFIRIFYQIMSDMVVALTVYEDLLNKHLEILERQLNALAYLQQLLANNPNNSALHFRVALEIEHIANTRHWIGIEYTTRFNNSIEWAYRVSLFSEYLSNIVIDYLKQKNINIPMCDDGVIKNFNPKPPKDDDNEPFLKFAEKYVLNQNTSASPVNIADNTVQSNSTTTSGNIKKNNLTIDSDYNFSDLVRDTLTDNSNMSNVASPVQDAVSPLTNIGENSQSDKLFSNTGGGVNPLSEGEILSSTGENENPLPEGEILSSSTTNDENSQLEGES